MRRGGGVVSAGIQVIIRIVLIPDVIIESQAKSGTDVTGRILPLVGNRIDSGRAHYQVPGVVCIDTHHLRKSCRTDIEAAVMHKHADNGWAGHVSEAGACWNNHSQRVGRTSLRVRLEYLVAMGRVVSADIKISIKDSEFVKENSGIAGQKPRVIALGRVGGTDERALSEDGAGEDKEFAIVRNRRTKSAMVGVEREVAEKCSGVLRQRGPVHAISTSQDARRGQRAAVPGQSAIYSKSIKCLRTIALCKSRKSAESNIVGQELSWKSRIGRSLSGVWQCSGRFKYLLPDAGNR